jgi:hypothetical protein
LLQRYRAHANYTNVTGPLWRIKTIRVLPRAL